MRYLELSVTDLSDTDHRSADGTDQDPSIRTEWIHPDHIETIEPYTQPGRARQMLWLEITLTSGRTRYIPVRPVHPDHIDDIARHAIATLIDSGRQPVRGAALTDLLDGNPVD